MKLVAYFSATGTTEKLAERVASVLKADIFEIKPKEPYTRDDLNWNNQNSRSSKEMNNRSFRSEIKEKIANIEDYDTIYIGFPIWWYIAPTIINTFLESYDLTGKTIIPFATSGGSGMGNTNKELKDSCKGAILKEGKRLRVTASDEEIEELEKN
jgi:hypothetical protein